jgi:hypothetical protein
VLVHIIPIAVSFREREAFLQCNDLLSEGRGCCGPIVEASHLVQNIMFHRRSVAVGVCRYFIPPLNGQCKAEHCAARVRLRNGYSRDAPSAHCGEDDTVYRQHRPMNCQEPHASDPALLLSLRERCSTRLSPAAYPAPTTGYRISYRVSPHTVEFIDISR